ncbi:MAG: ABC transporter permease [Phycisphaerales bacterium]
MNTLIHVLGAPVRLLFQTVFLALGQIWSNKGRAVLTTLGIVIGVAAVIGTVWATQGLRGFVLEQFESIGASRVWVFPRMPRDQVGRFSWRQVRMTNAEAEGMLAACPSLKRLTPIKSFTSSVQYGDRTEPNVAISGIWPSWHDIENRTVINGRPFLSVDDENRHQVCLVNDKAIEELGMSTNCVGETLLIAGSKFLIVGVVETKSVSPMFGGGESRTEVYIPFKTADTMRPEWMSGLYIAGQTNAPEDFEEAKAEIVDFMRKRRKLQPGDPNTFGVEAIEQAREQFNKVAVYMTAGAMIIVGISLVVGGVGIMNIMLVSVSERTREIGLRKAVGAPPVVIMIQFLVEAVVLCLVGGAIGLTLGFGIKWLTAMNADNAFSKAAIPLWAVGLSVGFSAGTGIIFGLFPAIKAARLDPIEALRHE